MRARPSEFWRATIGAIQKRRYSDRDGRVEEGARGEREYRRGGGVPTARRNVWSPLGRFLEKPRMELNGAPGSDR